MPTLQNNNSLGLASGPSNPMPLYKPNDTVKFKLRDSRKVNPVTGKPFKETGSKSLDVDQRVVSDIVAHAKANGIDPYTALAISYQESGLNKDQPFNLNPDVYGKSFGNAKEGVGSIVNQMNYARSLQKKGVIPQGEDYLLQGYNGYGKIKRGHQDLEGANSIYGMQIPDEGIDLKKNPLYGKTIISLRDEILKKHPDIQRTVESTQPYKEQTNLPLPTPGLQNPMFSTMDLYKQ